MDAVDYGCLLHFARADLVVTLRFVTLRLLPDVPGPVHHVGGDLTRFILLVVGFVVATLHLVYHTQLRLRYATELRLPVTDSIYIAVARLRLRPRFNRSDLQPGWTFGWIALLDISRVVGPLLVGYLRLAHFTLFVVGSHTLFVGLHDSRWVIPHGCAFRCVAPVTRPH